MNTDAARPLTTTDPTRALAGPVPPLALEFLRFTLIVAGLVMLRQAGLGNFGLNDVDLGWHLAYGEHFIGTHSLATHDTWSWTSVGKPYQLTQWGGQVVLAAANLAAGNYGLMALASSTLAATLVLAFATLRRLGIEYRIAAVAACIAPLTIWGAPVRPLIFGWLCCAWLTFHLVGLWRSSKPLPDGVGALAALALWTNLHGSFAVGVIATVCVCLTRVYCSLRRGDLWREDVQMVQIAGLAAAATLLNPYGYKVWLPLWEIAGLETTQFWITEWKPTRMFSSMGVPMVFLGLALFTLAHARRIGTAELLGGLALLAVGLQYNRNVPLVSIFGAGYVALAVAYAESALGKPQAIRPGMRLGLPAALCAGGLAAALYVGAQPADEVEAERFPVKAGEFLARSGLQGRLFNDSDDGGWLIRRHPQFKVMIDGRADLHPDALYTDMLRIMDLRPGWRKALASLDPDILLVRSRSALRQGVVGSADFAAVFEAEGSTVLVRRRAPYLDFIQSHELRLDDGDPADWALRLIPQR